MKGILYKIPWSCFTPSHAANNDSLTEEIFHTILYISLWTDSIVKEKGVRNKF